MIPIELRSRADGVALAVDHARALLPADIPPADATPAEAMRAFGAESREWQAWMVWRAMVLFRDAWQAFEREQNPAQGERPRTMETAAVETAA